MRITKRRLKQIIREEYSRLADQGLLSESSFVRRNNATYYNRLRLKSLIRETIEELEEADIDEKAGFSKKLDLDGDGEDDLEIGFTAAAKNTGKKSGKNLR